MYDHAPSRFGEFGPSLEPPAVHAKMLRDELVAAAEWAARYLGELPEGPVSRPLPPQVRARLCEGQLRERGGELGGVLDFVREEIAPYPTGNGHPAFFAWVNSPPAPAGIVADLLACAVNATCGMGENALMDLERGTVRMLADLAGLLPCCTFTTLGTTATGAVDPLEPVTELCRSEGMWHHADGAWGGLGAAVAALAPHYAGVGGIDSLTVDPHKTLSVPVGCGALLVPDPEHLHTAFAHQASYLTAGEPDALPWLSHATIELTRPGTRALALWATLHHLGRDGVTALIEQYLALADQLRERINTEPRLHLLAGGPWPVACFRLTDPDDADADALHTRIARRVQDNGRAYLATVAVHGRTVLRAALCNYRTTTDDLDLLIREVLDAADAEHSAPGTDQQPRHR
ncbi:pyridoxal phosphate-dependent decarboxylase family protein [Streptomyces sp. NPDC101455]|uniref:pyridoxal phosphate-dependent decarboxylase family protein n=1 Tax=Streptomyces sp. NPDC101455 TaxID=3366142 RepID=UPI003814B372